MCPTSRPALLAAESNQKRLATAKVTPIALGANPVSVTLEPLPDPDGTKPYSLTARVKTSVAGRRFYLIVKDLRAEAQPGVLYHLYLELPSGAARDAASTPSTVAAPGRFSMTVATPCN